MKQIIVLIVLAAVLQWQSYEADAGIFGSVTKKATGRVMQKPNPAKAPASKKGATEAYEKANTANPVAQIMSDADMAKYRELLVKLDRDILNGIQAKYGAYINPAAKAWAEKTPTTFLDKRVYRKALHDTDPSLTDGEIENILGFHANATRKTYVDRNTPLTPHVTAHERFHQLSSPKFAEQFGNKIDEGATSHYALQVRRDLHLVDMDASYPEPRSIYQMMDARVGEEPLAKAYFQGDFRALRQALDDDLGVGYFDKLLNP